MKFRIKLDNRFSDGKFVEDVAIEVDKSGFFGARSLDSLWYGVCWQ